MAGKRHGGQPAQTTTQQVRWGAQAQGRLPRAFIAAEGKKISEQSMLCSDMGYVDKKDARAHSRTQTEAQRSGFGLEARSSRMSAR